MKKIGFLLLLVACMTSRATGQTVALDLAKAQDAYEKSNLEQAKLIFASIIASRQQVTQEQRVTAYKYLGAYWALQSARGAADSANAFFIAALDHDPFTELETSKFATDEQNAFARAKSLIFKVGIEPIKPKAIDTRSSNPDSSVYTFRIVTTHLARLRIEILSARDPNKRHTFPSIGNNNGVREVPWNGLIDAERADTGLYEFRVTATDGLPGRETQPQVVESQRFRIEHVHAALEDTLPDFRDVNLGGTDTLKSARPRITPLVDAGKGVLVSSVAVGLPLVLTQRKNMSATGSHLLVGVSLGVLAGGTAAWYGTRNRADAAAVLENTRRTKARAQFNADVRARNRARLDKTILVIRPLTSAGTGG